MIELTFLKELMLIIHANQKSAIFATIDINKRSRSQSYVCNRCHDLIMMSRNINDMAILNIKGADYRCIITGISKS